MSVRAVLGAALIISVSATLTSCLKNNTLSCHGSKTASCCYNYPGGALLQTQFWDTDPSTGPADSWTIHGLWPDNCDGTYQSYCDSSRNYGNITEILQAQNRTDLLSYMKQYWVDIKGDDETFWQHEWEKHGTCINTISPSCYTEYTSEEEVSDFFQKVVDLFKGLDTYQALSKAGITPDSSTTYSLSDIQSALSNMHGSQVYIGCEDGALDQVWYFFNVRGNAITGQYEATDTLTTTKCPDSVKYLPKSST